MPFNTNQRAVVNNANGGVVLLIEAGKVSIVELPKGTTHVTTALDGVPGVARCFVWPDPGSEHNAAVDSLSGGLPVWSGAVAEHPVANTDRPRVGLSIDAADRLALGSVVRIRVVPHTDPVVAILRTQRGR